MPQPLVTEAPEDLAIHLTVEIIRSFKKHNVIVPREQIDVIVGEVRKALDEQQKGLTELEGQLRGELETLSSYIRQAKRDIASIQPKDIKSNHIPLATDELDAVVGATEEATNKIMDICDEVSTIAETAAPDIKDKLASCTTRIFEACNFQDITGQRITKVVNALKHIDTKVEALLAALGEEFQPEETETPAEGDGLLNGPQLPGQGMDQDMIDRLLAQE